MRGQPATDFEIKDVLVRADKLVRPSENADPHLRDVVQEDSLYLRNDMPAQLPIGQTVNLYSIVDGPTRTRSASVQMGELLAVPGPGAGSTQNCNPAFRAPASDDYRLAGGQGVTWTPADFRYGP